MNNEKRKHLLERNCSMDFLNDCIALDSLPCPLAKMLYILDRYWILISLFPRAHVSNRKVKS